MSELLRDELKFFVHTHDTIDWCLMIASPRQLKTNKMFKFRWANSSEAVIFCCMETFCYHKIWLAHLAVIHSIPIIDTIASTDIKFLYDTQQLRGHRMIVAIHQILHQSMCHDDVIKWKHFPRNWPFVREIHRSPVNFPHKGQWRGALMFSLIYAWINDWVNNREAGDLRRQHGHYDVVVMCLQLDMCVCMYVCVCVRACVCVSVWGRGIDEWMDGRTGGRKDR